MMTCLLSSPNIVTNSIQMLDLLHAKSDTSTEEFAGALASVVKNVFMPCFIVVAPCVIKVSFSGN